MQFEYQFYRRLLIVCNRIIDIISLLILFNLKIWYWRYILLGKRVKAYSLHVNNSSYFGKSASHFKCHPPVSAAT